MRSACVVDVSQMKDDINSVLQDHVGQKFDRVFKSGAKISDDSNFAFLRNTFNSEILNAFVVDVVNLGLAFDHEL